jgi:fructose PTS system EIIBC or EIIC component
VKKIVNIYKNFMNGFTYIIPLAVVGGVFLTLNNQINNVLLFDFGSTALFLIYPILAGFIAFAIADRPAFILGLLAGAIATVKGGGFLSATLIGFLSGYLIILFNHVFKKLPYGIKGLNPVFIYPILGTILMFFVIQGFEITVFPIEIFVKDIYQNLDKIFMIIIVGILSAMMAYDLGGPINKIAYLIGVLSILNGNNSYMMPAVMIAGMMPPLIIASSALIFKNKYSKEEHIIARKNWLLGLSFITEGAIPFIKKDKMVKYVFVISSMTAGILSVLFDVSSMIAHGGILAFFLANNVLVFLIILIASTVVFGFILGFILPKNKVLM